MALGSIGPALDRLGSHSSRWGWSQSRVGGWAALAPSL